MKGRSQKTEVRGQEKRKSEEGLAASSFWLLASGSRIPVFLLTSDSYAND
jgi:hypothetical protein